MGNRASLNGAAYPRHGHVLQAPGDEGEHADGRPIEPVRIVNEQGHGIGICGIADEPECSHRNSKGIGVDAGRHSERSLERHALRVGQEVERTDDGEEELVQPCEPKLRLRLRSGRREHGEANGVRLVTHVTKHRRLSDAGFSADDERAASLVQAIHECVEALDLRVAPDQLLSRLGHGPSIETASVRLALEL
jgi:hypothetical protein